jgi:caspase domain-containing protein
MTIWALIIAIENYPNVADGLARILPGTNAAAEVFRNWAMTVKGVQEANVFACAEPACAWRTTGTTRPEIANALVNLVGQARDNADELYVFFSGHGIGFAETPYLPPIDVLISSDFTTPSTSGPACILVSELKESLRVALGPGKHFYFIDACRNPMGRNDISPTGLGVVFGRSKLGNATTFLLFSTAPGDVANVNSGFNAALLRGLKGSGRAKEWLGGSMHVTFDRLTSFVQKALQKNDLEPEVRGPLAAHDSIVELNPTPTSTCTIEVIGAGANDQFTLTATDLRQGSRPWVPFVGPRCAVPFPPEDYLLRLTTTVGQRVPQVDPPPDPPGVDLYDDRKVQFELPTTATPPSVEPPAPEDGTLRIFGVPGAEISLHQIASGLTQTIQMTSGEFVTNLTPGDYLTQFRDGNFHLESARISVQPNARLDIDFRPKISSGAQASLAAAIPNQDSLISFQRH